jgi:hypothetical protein
MCRSIKTLREPYVDQVADDDIRAAALDRRVVLSPPRRSRNS